MTQNRRIILNVIATYGRSLYSLVLGLFTARWVLMALGEVDFGLYGLVGGLTMFVIFINELFAMSVARFFGVSVGASKKNGENEAGVDECRKWFSTAVLIHTLVPLVAIVMGYPIGEWIVRCFLTIPAERVMTCVWVWRFTCLSCFVGMVNVPFRAMYTAKQEIAELTVYSFASTTVTAAMLYYMASHKGDWLFGYALGTCLIAIVPHVLIGWRAVVRYPECRVVRSYFWSTERMLEIVKFAVARFFTSFSSLISSQGQQILVNKYLGPQCNAAMRVGASVASHAGTLAGSLSGAFWPAITNVVGEGDDEKVRKMCFQVCRMGAALVSIFAIPLCLEAREILRLWLVRPPAFSTEICIFILINGIAERMTEGYWMAILGFGRDVAKYSRWVCWSGFVGLGISWALFAINFGMWSVCYAILIAKAITVVVRLYLGWTLASLSFRYWVIKVFLPLGLSISLAYLVGCLVVLTLPRGLIRICLTTVTSEVIFLPMCWLFVLAAEERMFVISRLRKLLKKK